MLLKPFFAKTRRVHSTDRKSLSPTCQPVTTSLQPHNLPNRLHALCSSAMLQRYNLKMNLVDIYYCNWMLNEKTLCSSTLSKWNSPNVIMSIPIMTS